MVTRKLSSLRQSAFQILIRLCLPDLYVAIGQYLVYQDLMQRYSNDNPLYLAIPTKVYYGIFKPMAGSIVDRNGIKLVLVNLEQEVIEKWLE